VQTYTPAEVQNINNARAQLLREAKKAGTKRLAPFRPIKDDRLPHKAATGYSYFFGERMASGDFKGMKIIESGTLIAREWKALSAAETKVNFRPV
jgi:hypothetical protein